MILHSILLLFLVAAPLTDARKGNEAYQKGNYEAAESYYKAALEQEPDNARLYFNLGNAQARQGKIEEAIQSFLEFRNLAETPEDKALAEYNIGTVLAEDERWQPAASHFKNSLKLNPDDFDAKFNYERALSEQQKENQEQDNQGNQPPPEPSDYARAMKRQAEKLVDERRYTEAYELMMEALKADKTVQAFSNFITRIKDVAQIHGE